MESSGATQPGLCGPLQGMGLASPPSQCKRRREGQGTLLARLHELLKMASIS